MEFKFFSAAVCLAVGAQSAVSYASGSDYVGSNLGRDTSLASRKGEVKGESVDESVDWAGSLDVKLRNLGRGDSRKKSSIKGSRKGVASKLDAFLASRKFRTAIDNVLKLFFWLATAVISGKMADRYLAKNYLKTVPANPNFIPSDVSQKVKDLMTKGEVDFVCLGGLGDGERVVTENVARFLDSVVKDCELIKKNPLEFVSGVKYSGTKEEKEKFASTLRKLPVEGLLRAGILGDLHVENLDRYVPVLGTVVTTESSLVDSSVKAKRAADWNVWSAASAATKRWGKNVAWVMKRVMKYPEEKEPEVDNDLLPPEYAYDDFKDDLFDRFYSAFPKASVADNLAGVANDILMRSDKIGWGWKVLSGVLKTGTSVYNQLSGSNASSGARQ